jgi:hypothetical protein
MIVMSKDMQKNKKILKYQEEHKNTPYKELVNFDLNRTLTPAEMTAVEWWVDVVLDSGQYRDNAMRSIIVGGGITNILRSYNSCSSGFEMFLGSDRCGRGW